MKYVLVTFRVPDPSKPRDGYRYPKRYDAQLVQNSGNGAVLYDHTAGFDANGEQECLVLVDDVLATRFDAAEGMKIISDGEADTWVAGNATIQQAPEYLVDRDMVAALHARVAAGITLTPDEMNYLDPDHDSGGIRRADRSKEAIFRVRR